MLTASLAASPVNMRTPGEGTDGVTVNIWRPSRASKARGVVEVDFELRLAKRDMVDCSCDWRIALSSTRDRVPLRSVVACNRRDGGECARWRQGGPFA